MATFITRLENSTSGIRLAVKDLIDVAGVPTTAGSRALADTAAPALADAPCLVGARAARVAIVGKVNLHELAFGASGVNDYFGTPVNPLDPRRVPGGSSSGSAVAVADGDADIAYGSDTGGSIRIPMAVDVAGVAAGMTLLEPGFRLDTPPAGRVGRIRPAGSDVHADIDAAIDQALARSGLAMMEIDLPGWPEASAAAGVIIDAEAGASNRFLLDDPVRRDLLGGDVRARLIDGAATTAAQLAQARAFQSTWRTAMTTALLDVDVLALPTVMFYPPLLSEAARMHYTALTNPVNLSGCPALALPVPSAQRLPASLQLIGRPDSEALLLVTGAIIEATAGYRPAP
jgi:amidase